MAIDEVAVSAEDGDCCDECGSDGPSRRSLELVHDIVATLGSTTMRTVTVSLRELH